MKKHFLLHVLCLLSAAASFGQTPEFQPRRNGSNTFFYSKWRFYGFNDIVRQMGAGVIYSPHPNIELNAGLGYINSFLWQNYSFISSDEYFFYRGGALNFSATFYSKRNQGFYSGVHGSYRAYGYKNQWASPDNSSAYYQEFRNKQMTSLSAGPTIGYSFRIPKVSINLFLKGGLELATGTVTVNDVKGYYSNLPQAPYAYATHSVGGFLMGGISVGYGQVSKPGNMYRYYKQMYEQRMKPLFLQASRMHRKGLITFGDVLDVRNMGHDTYVELSKNYMQAIFDDAEMQKILERGVQQIQKFLEEAVSHKD